MEDKKKVTSEAKKSKKREGKNPPREWKPLLTAERLLMWKKGFWGRVVCIIFAVLVFIACFNYAFDYTVEVYGDGAYKYSEEAYTYIKESISNYLGDDGPDIRKLQECFPKEIAINKYITSKGRRKLKH